MYPAISLQPKQGKRLRDGHPWVYSNELVMDAAAKALPAGSIVQVNDQNGRALGLAHFNPHTLIAARMLARGIIADIKIDAGFWAERLSRAVALRDALVDVPYYRLSHAEADGLPGLIIDRFNDCVVVQGNTAGMQAAKADICEALETVLKPATIIWRGDTPARGLEGLGDEVEVVKGSGGTFDVRENGIIYKADVLGGQKTGWFYDQRRNRALVAEFAKGKTVLDLYTHTGGFGMLSAARGASEVVCVDRSEHALQLASDAAKANNLSNIRFEKQDIFEFCGAHKDKRFDVVIADPPAFAKSKKDVGPASRGYRKLARLAATLLKPDGFFFMASCSHAITRERFDDEVIAGLQDANKTGAILARTGADLDHPTHPHLPESSYLKGILIHST
jgi:23S rRNA (cytosine1962-C5)-methyltransferase